MKSERTCGGGKKKREKETYAQIYITTVYL